MSKTEIVGLTHSFTDNQISKHGKQGQSPKLPQGIRDIQHSFGNILFTGKLPTAQSSLSTNQQSSKEFYESQETLVDKTISDRDERQIPDFIEEQDITTIDVVEVGLGPRKF
jgi:hypothetical protein